MRFSLRTLFWIFPVTLLAYGLSYLEASIAYIDTRFEATSTLRMTREYADVYAEYQKQSLIQFDVMALNQWLVRSLAPTHPQAAVFDAIEKNNLWRTNSLEAVALDAEGNPLPDRVLAERVGFYVRRPDRVPLAGTDMVEVLNNCTFNSWSTTRDEALQYDRQKLNRLIQTRALWNWPWALALLGISLAVAKPLTDVLGTKLRKLFTREPSIPPADEVWPLS